MSVRFWFWQTDIYHCTAVSSWWYISVEWNYGLEMCVYGIGLKWEWNWRREDYISRWFHLIKYSNVKILHLMAAYFRLNSKKERSKCYFEIIFFTLRMGYGPIHFWTQVVPLWSQICSLIRSPALGCISGEEFLMMRPQQMNFHMRHLISSSRHSLNLSLSVNLWEN